jgi:hypothetical protein
MKTWTQDNRPVVWTVTPNMTDRYDLYIRGVCVGEGLTFTAWYALYNLYKKGV